MTALLTRVTLVSIPRRVNVYLRFGTPSKIVSRDRYCRDAYFASGRVFCRVWWEGGRYGTAHWQLDILQAKLPGEPIQTVQGIAPGAVSLLSVRGERCVKAVMRAIDAIVTRGLPPANTSVSYWRMLHNRLVAGQPATTYGVDRHVAETWRCRVA